MGRVQDIVRATVLGVGAIFQSKTRPDDHWSATPEVHLVVESETDDSGTGSGAGRVRGD